MSVFSLVSICLFVCARLCCRCLALTDVIVNHSFTNFSTWFSKFKSSNLFNLPFPGVKRRTRRFSLLTDFCYSIFSRNAPFLVISKMINRIFFVLFRECSYHLAEKNIPSIHGHTMGYKLEQFIFDAFPYAPSTALFEVHILLHVANRCPLRIIF